MTTKPTQQLIDALKGKFVLKSEEAKEVFEKAGFEIVDNAMFWAYLHVGSDGRVYGSSGSHVQERNIKVYDLSEIVRIIESHSVADANASIAPVREEGWYWVRHKSHNIDRPMLWDNGWKFQRGEFHADVPESVDFCKPIPNPDPQATDATFPRMMEVSFFDEKDRFPLKIQFVNRFGAFGMLDNQWVCFGFYREITSHQPTKDEIIELGLKAYAESKGIDVSEVKIKNQ